MDDSKPAGIGHNRPPISETLPEDHAKLLDRVQALANRANAVKEIVDEKGLKSDEDVEPLIAVGKEATKLEKELDETRLATTKPLRDEVDAINAFFKTPAARVTRIKQAFAEKVDGYVEEKKAREAREAAERARLAEEAAAARLKEAEEARHSVLGDVILNEAAALEDAAQKAAHEAVKAGTGPARFEAGTASQSGKWTFEIEDADKIPLEQLRPFVKLADIEKFLRAYATANRNTKPLAGVRFFRETKTSFR